MLTDTGDQLKYQMKSLDGSWETDKVLAVCLKEYEPRLEFKVLLAPDPEYSRSLAWSPLFLTHPCP